MVKSSYYWKNEFLVKRMFWGEQMDDEQYNRFGKADFSGVLKLTSAQKMVELSTEADKDGYTGLYYFMKGWYFWRATMDTGDIPYSEALNIEEYVYPKYDEQKDVFKGILSDLALAEEYFSKATKAFDGDPFYNGDPLKWRKATNVLRLKVLMSLQKRADDTPELNIKEQFAQIVNGGVLFSGNDDNLQVVYSDLETNRNPYHKEYTRSIETFAATNMIVDPMKEYKDKTTPNKFVKYVRSTPTRYSNGRSKFLIELYEKVVEIVPYLEELEILSNSKMQIHHSTTST